MLVLHNAWAAMLGYHALAALVVFFAPDRPPLKQLFACPGSKLTLLAVMFGAGGGVLLYLLWPSLSVAADVSAHLESLGLTRESWPWFLAYMVFVGPLVEEYFWRGYLGPQSRRPVLNDVLFAGYHLLVLGAIVRPVWLIPIFVSIAASAWFWRQLNTYGKGLLAPVASHMAADISVMLAVHFLLIIPR